MLWTIAGILGLLWILGMASSTIAGGYVHVLILAAAAFIGYALFRRHRERRSS